MNYCELKTNDVANGPGVRVSLFVSGCTHRCKGCFNEESWDFNAGEEFTKDVEDKILEALSPSYVSGLTLLGGEPFEHANQQGLLPFLRRVKETYPQKNIWCFTGYLFDKDILGRMCKEWPETKEMLDMLSTLAADSVEQQLRSGNLPEAYQKAWNSFLVARDAPKRDEALKAVMRKKVLRLLEEKKCSNYRVYTDLKLNPGNINSWLKNGDCTKVSYHTAERVMNYVLQFQA